MGKGRGGGGGLGIGDSIVEKEGEAAKINISPNFDVLILCFLSQ